MMLTSSKRLYVHYNKRDDKWIAQPTINNKRMYKRFEKEIDAIKFVNEASDELVINQKMN